MSRTFRRKNYELENNTSWDVKGRKTAGFYTEYDYKRDEDGRVISYDWHVYREPTEHERNQAYYRNHGESGTASSNSPNSYHRKMRMRENRRINKEELLKYLKSPDTYEPIFEDDPRNCWWDWS